jgi:hypothetical protein
VLFYTAAGTAAFIQSLPETRPINKIGNNPSRPDLTRWQRAQAEPAMPERDNNSGEQIDSVTSVMICKAIGERLRKNFAPAPHLPSRLQDLLEQLRSQDSQSHS